MTAALTADERALLARLDAGETVVVNLHHKRLIDHLKAGGLLVRIDRRTRWGNPFRIPGDGDRVTVVARYEHHLGNTPALLGQIATLKGKALGCWCAPLPCHGDVLARWAEAGR